MAAVTSNSNDDAGSGRFVYLHSTSALSVLRTMTASPQIGVSLGGHFQMSPMWHEGMATKGKKLMSIGGRFVASLNELILKSSCIYVGNPLYKCPDNDCQAKEQFEEIDLEHIPEDYFPRTNLQSLVPINQLRAQSADVPWDETRKHVDYFRNWMPRTCSVRA